MTGFAGAGVCRLGGWKTVAGAWYGATAATFGSIQGWAFCKSAPSQLCWQRSSKGQLQGQGRCFFRLLLSVSELGASTAPRNVQPPCMNTKSALLVRFGAVWPALPPDLAMRLAFPSPFLRGPVEKCRSTPHACALHCGLAGEPAHPPHKVTPQCSMPEPCYCTIAPPSFHAQSCCA